MRLNPVKAYRWRRRVEWFAAEAHHARRRLEWRDSTWNILNWKPDLIRKQVNGYIYLPPISDGPTGARAYLDWQIDGPGSWKLPDWAQAACEGDKRNE